MERWPEVACVHMDVPGYSALNHFQGRAFRVGPVSMDGCTNFLATEEM